MAWKINKLGLDLIKEFEGYHTRLPDGRCQAYLDRLAAKKYWTPGHEGLITIGYGCTEGDLTLDTIWTEKQAEDALRREVRKHEDAVNEMLKVPVNQNQFSALVSLSYNIGAKALKRSSLMKALNRGDDPEDVAKKFTLYRRAGGKVYKGLVRRRAREAQLFLALPRKEVVKQSRKLTLLQRLRVLLPTGGLGAWLSWENLTSVREFMVDYSGFIALGVGAGLWVVFKLLENKSIEDYESGRYVPSGVSDVRDDE